VGSAISANCNLNTIFCIFCIFFLHIRYLLQLSIKFAYFAIVFADSAYYITDFIAYFSAHLFTYSLHILYVVHIFFAYFLHIILHITFNFVFVYFANHACILCMFCKDTSKSVGGVYLFIYTMAQLFTYHHLHNFAVFRFIGRRAWKVG
jgi:hypothetical protein